ncbi:hypothetical protein [Pseudomonas simiae]|uniref:hypothetical protein n=1 Tax=Pseudomonas simiae TaxID=321846 RepID=UPI0020D1EACD|nr:hypothetical protein [Pseudomonas simiae]
MGYTDLDSGNFGGGRNAYGTQYTQPAGKHSHNITIGASGGNESRPPNIAFIYCIKY